MISKWVCLIASTTFLALILIYIWFGEGYMLSYAESSLPFYNLQRYFNLTSFAWTEYPGLGNVSLITVASKPTYFILSQIQNLGVEGFLVQAGVFFLLLLSGGIGIALLTEELFGKISFKYLMLSVLFYWFNPLSLSNVWNRFLLNYMFFFGSLPLLCLFFVKGLKTKSYKWAIVFTLASVLYSFAFSYLAFPILLWITLTLLLLFFILNTPSEKKFYFKYFLLTLFLFVFTNLWWITQPLSLGRNLGFANVFKDLLESQNNLGTFDTLSKNLGSLTDLYRLSNASFIKAYSTPFDMFHPLITLLEFSFITIVLLAVFKKSKDSYFIFYFLVLLTIFYLAKGSSPPFSELYRALFSRFTILQVLRNPFEKFSFVLSVVFTPVFIYSLYFLLKDSPKKIKNTVYLMIFSFILIIWGYPFFTGLVFTTKEPPANNPKIGYKIKIPEYYFKANSWLNSQVRNFRYIGFPLKDEGITYKWERGYSGVELSSALFDTPGILFNTSVPFFNKIVPEIEKSLLETDNFENLANILNVKYFYIREDIDLKARQMTNPQVITDRMNILLSKNLVAKAQVFEKITFWQNLKWQDFTFYPATKFVDISSNPTTANLLQINPASKSAALLRKEDLKLIDKSNSDNSPIISYKKVNPTKYIVQVKNYTAPFILVFSELYNEKWIAYSNNKTYLPHIFANLYANGWLVEGNGDTQITVEFTPQRWLAISENISLVILILLLIALISIVTKERVQRK